MTVAVPPDSTIAQQETDTAILILLDRSQSMGAIKAATEAGLRSYLDEQRTVPGRCTVRFVQFNHHYHPVHESLPISQVPYPVLMPSGTTALLDAWGRAMTEFQTELNSRPTPPDYVIFVVITDGLENASQEWTKQMVRTVVEEKTAKEWRFIYLGANHDAVREGTGYGVGAGQTMAYGPTAQGVTNVFTASSVSTRSFRGGKTAEFTEEDRKRARGD